MTEGIIAGPLNEKESNELSDGRLRVRGDKRPKRSAKQAFLSCSFIGVCVFRRAKMIHVCPSNAVGSGTGDLKSKGFGSER